MQDIELGITQEIQEEKEHIEPKRIMIPISPPYHESSSPPKMNPIIFSAKEPHTPESQNSENSKGSYANNWTKNNERIIKRWIDTLNQNSFIYDSVSENYTKKHSIIQIILLLFNSILTVISFLQFNSDNETELEIYKYLIMIISTIVTFVVNIQRIKKYEDKFNNYSSISLELSELTLSILSQTEMPYNMRPDFNDYIKIVRQKYYGIMNKLPNIDNKDYMKAYDLFNNFKNLECRQNFRHQLANDRMEIKID